MNVLLVYAHQEPTSFTCALKDTAEQALSAAGHHVEVSDLYGEGFNPVAGRHDFTTTHDAGRFHYQNEQGHAHANGGFAPDLAREQQRVLKADLIIWIYPIWWGGVPAILKGWFDRVMAFGFAYADGKRFDSGYFRDKTGVLCLTTGGTVERFSADNVYGPIDQVLYPTQHLMLDYLGMKFQPPFVAYAAPRIDAAGRTAYLQQWRDRVIEIAADRRSAA
ncbi:NAD(P)H-dependent oxidoreductase [soil metagenome]